MLAVIVVMASMVEATRTMVSMTMAINMVKTTMIKVSPQRNGEEGHGESKTKLKIILISAEENIIFYYHIQHYC